MRGDKTVAGFSPLWRAVLETLKAQEDAGKELSPAAPSATGKDSAEQFLTSPMPPPLMCSLL